MGEAKFAKKKGPNFQKPQSTSTQSFGGKTKCMVIMSMDGCLYKI